LLEWKKPETVSDVISRLPEVLRILHKEGQKLQPHQLQALVDFKDQFHIPDNKWGVVVNMFKL